MVTFDYVVWILLYRTDARRSGSRSRSRRCRPPPRRAGVALGARRRAAAVAAARAMLSSLTWGEYGGAAEAAEAEEARAARRRRARPHDSGPPWYERCLARLESAACAECAAAFGVPRYRPLPPLSGELAAAARAASAARGGAAARDDRAAAKHQQLVSLAAALAPALRAISAELAVGDAFGARRAPVVADLCGGSGHVALFLAAIYDDARFVVVDNKPGSLALAEDRIRAAGLGDRVAVALADVASYAEPFDVGVALHACGEATDMALAAVRACSARAFAVVPCCVGKLAQARVHDKFPRSRAAAQAGVSRQEFLMLARAADVHTVAGIEKGGGTRPQRRRRLAKTAVEVDRMCAMTESASYCTHMMLLEPLDSSAKNDVCVGWLGDACPYCAEPGVQEFLAPWADGPGARPERDAR